MIDRIIEFSIRNRTLVLGCGLALALWGAYALFQTPIDAIPNLSENQAIVFTDWMGHSPREIEDQITYPLSVHLQGLAGVRVVRSSSDFNFSTINVILEDSVDFYFARQQIGERLARAADLLPAGATPYLAPDGVATGQIFWYAVEGSGYDLGRLRAIQDFYVGPQLASVPGVAEVASVGGQVVEYQLEINPQRLADAGLTPGDVVREVARANAAVGGHVIQKANAEYIVRGVGWLGAGAEGEGDVQRAVLRDLENVILPAPRGGVRVADVARVSLGAAFRRGVLEKDGTEVTGGVVLMRYNENPLEVTRRLHLKLAELSAGLPAGVRITPVYDRTPLIEGAMWTVTGTVLEAILTATVCVVLVLLHFRTSLIIAVTLPLAALASFAIMWSLRKLGLADIQTNIMSLAGIAISIGVLVDSSIVMAENAMFALKQHFGDRPVRGDVRHIVLPACRTVGRPIFFSVAIMLISFLPVFALGGMEGKMFRPLAFTKSFALAAVAGLAITLVPALCTLLIRGRLRSERESWLVRSVIDVYRPTLNYLLDRPAGLIWVLGVTFLMGTAPLGLPWLFLATLFAFLVAVGWSTRSLLTGGLGMGSLALAALIMHQQIQPLAREFMTPLDEGMVMDMPITVPRASITQSADDLKARDMLLCRFPEVAMVVGKAGRAETPTDPAPLDMIETMVEFRPAELWPQRKLRAQDALRHAQAIYLALIEARLLTPAADESARDALIDEALMEAMPRYDAAMREYAYQRNEEFRRELGPRLVQFALERWIASLQRQGLLKRELAPSDAGLLASKIPAELSTRLGQAPALADVARLARLAADQALELDLAKSGRELLADDPGPVDRLGDLAALAVGRPAGTPTGRLLAAIKQRHLALWRSHVGQLNAELLERGCETFTRVALEELLVHGQVADASLADYLRQMHRWRSRPPRRRAGGHHAAAAPHPGLPPEPRLKQLQTDLADGFRRWVLLRASTRPDLSGFGGELDRALQMPGWTNVWTMPIQNRVDMLATGVNTAVGIRVLGRSLDDVVRASEEIAQVVKRVPGAADVVADPIRGKGYLEIRPDRAKAAELGVSVADINDVVEIALGGKRATVTVEGRERHPVRVRYARDWREDEQSVSRLLIPVRGAGGLSHVPLSQVASVQIVEGPATIKSENGLLRNYVRLNVRGRGSVDFVQQAQSVVAQRVRLPEGTYLEWTGQFEHQQRSRQTLLWISPLVVGLIFTILYLTYRDLADALLMLLAVPGALAGGVCMQWLLGYPFTVTVMVGYIACFGMATATGIIMLVYLREAVAKAGGVERMSLAQLRQAVLEGAVHRLRPKLLTEGTTILGLAPMLWATGVGAEVIKPMAAPVLGGILVADEVIDLLLPVLFYYVRRRRWRRLHAGPATALLAVGAAPATGDLPLDHLPLEGVT